MRLHGLLRSFNVRLKRLLRVLEVWLNGLLGGGQDAFGSLDSSASGILNVCNYAGTALVRGSGSGGFSAVDTIGIAVAGD